MPIRPEDVESARPALFPGCRLAIVAPSGPFDRETFEAGIAWLRTRYEVSVPATIHQRSGYLAGSDAHRLRQLQEALADPDIDAILCARGGYGTTRLLPLLDTQLIARARKPLIGFSDITALHALWARCGVRSWHAKMVADLGRACEGVRSRWTEVLEGRTPGLVWKVDTISSGDAEGRLVGGNLAVLAALLGTPYEPPVDGAVLFLEDVGERPYRVDRMLTSLRQAGWLERCAAVVLGAFTDSPPGPDGVCIEDVLATCLSGLGIPVASGLPMGHIEQNEPLPFGVGARLESGRLVIVNSGSLA